MLDTSSSFSRQPVVLALFAKTHVKDHDRHLSNGEVVHVAAHEDSRHAGGHKPPASVEENRRLGSHAMHRVIAENTDVPHAMYRPEHGWISFYWGSVGNPNKDFAGGSGVAKIIAKRTVEGADGEAVAHKLVDVIALGQAGPLYGPKGGERFNVQYDGHTAVLSLHRFGNEETWLLTGWNDVASDGGVAGNASATYTPTPSGIQESAGAEPVESIASVIGNDKFAKSVVLFLKAGNKGIKDHPGFMLYGNPPHYRRG